MSIKSVIKVGFTKSGHKLHISAGDFYAWTECSANARNLNGRQVGDAIERRVLDHFATIDEKREAFAKAAETVDASVVCEVCANSIGFEVAA